MHENLEKYKWFERETSTNYFFLKTYPDELTPQRIPNNMK